MGLGSLFLAAKMEEVYTPKIDNIITAANGTYGTHKIRDIEQTIYRTLDYEITPPTLNMWANWYMSQWDSFVQNCEFAKNHGLISGNGKVPLFKKPHNSSYNLYRQYMELVDCAILDIQTLQYKQRAIIAAFMYILLGKEFKQFTNDQILNDFPTSSLYLLNDSLPYNELYSYFISNFFGLALYDLLPTIQYGSTFFGLEFQIELPVAAKVDRKNVLEVV